jgi:hypothetical protein
MRLEVDQHEFEDLEIRLRRSVAGRRPAAPDELLRFIDTVPQSYRRRSRLATAIALPHLRAGFTVAATAAALIVATVAGVALVSVRNGQPGASIDPAAPVTGPGWTWQRGDGTGVFSGSRVANGYVGQCWRQESQGENPVFPCSSPDGANWSEGIDSRIMSVEGMQEFEPYAVASVDGTYVAWIDTYSSAQMSATPTPAGSGGSYTSYSKLVRSTDGIHFQPVDSPQFSNQILQSLAVESGAFVVSAQDYTGTSWALTSTDGLDWVRSSQVPASPCMVQSTGRFATCGGTQAWRTADGKSWTPIELPVSTYYMQVYAVPGGGFVALDGAVNSRQDKILRSADGLNWSVDQGNLSGEPGGLASAGGRLFTDVEQRVSSSSSAGASDGSSVDAYAIWQSVDWGHTWQPLLDGYGRQITGVPWALGDLLAISSVPTDSSSSSRLEWVGEPPAPPDTTTPASTPSGAIPPASATTQVWTCSLQDTPTSPAVMDGIAGLSGWQEIGRWWSSQAQLGACGSGTDQRAGASVAVVATCQGSGVLHVSLEDNTSAYEPGPSVNMTTPAIMSPPPVLASFDVQCPLSVSNPEVAFASTSADYVGKALTMQVMVDGDVTTFGLLLQTADGTLTSGSPSLTP